MSIQKLLKVSVILHHNYFKSVRILYVSMRHVQLNHLESMTCCFDSCGILNKKIIMYGCTSCYLQNILSAT